MGKVISGTAAGQCIDRAAGYGRQSYQRELPAT